MVSKSFDCGSSASVQTVVVRFGLHPCPCDRVNCNGPIIFANRQTDGSDENSLCISRGAYAKNGKTRTVPLNARAKAALRHLHSLDRGDMVFAKSDGLGYRSMRTAFELACERAGLQDVTPHTLRHTFATRLAIAGVDARTIMDLGGWKHLAMVERYTHPNPRHKVAAVKQIEDLFHNTGHNTPDEAKAQASVSA